MTLVKDAQNDFSAGGFPEVTRDDVPTNGFDDGINCLIDDDGSPFARGGSTYKSNAAMKTGRAPRLLWDGLLQAGQRTVWVGWATPAGATGSRICVLAADDATPVEMPIEPSAVVANDFLKAVVVNDVLYVDGGLVYAGSRKTVGYTIGGPPSVDLTYDSAIVTGTGTAFLANVDAGMLFSVANYKGTQYHHFVVKSVEDDTHLTLTEKYLPDSGVSSLGATGTFVPAAIQSGDKKAGIYASVSNRLIACSGNRFFETAIGDANYIPDGEFLDLPEGVTIIGAEGVRDILMLFTTAGVWAVSGLSYGLTDDAGNVQQRLEQINRDLILWSRAGVTNWQNSLIVPAVDGIWIMDQVSAPIKISIGISTKYRSYVTAGYKTGAAIVHKGNYYLPIVNSAGAWIDTLVCRLAPTRRGRQLPAFGWTRLSGDAAKIGSYAQRTPAAAPRDPVLLGNDLSTAKIVQLNYAAGPSGLVAPAITAEWAEGDGAFAALTGSAGPSDAEHTPFPWKVGQTVRSLRFRFTGPGALDADGSSTPWKFTTREIATGGGVKNFVKKVRLRYELGAAAARIRSLELFIRPSMRR